MDNNQNEIDIVKHQYSVGPAVKAGIFFLILVVTAGGSAYFVKQNTKGDIATSEIEVRKDDSAAWLELEKERDEAKAYVKELLSERAYDTDCAGMSLRDMRNRVQQSEVDK